MSTARRRRGPGSPPTRGWPTSGRPWSTNEHEANTAATETIDAARDAGDEIADETRSRAGQVRGALEGAVDHVPDVIEGARTGAERVAGRLPDAAERARLGVEQTTTRLQTLPDPNCGCWRQLRSAWRPGSTSRAPPPHHRRGLRARAPRRRGHGHPPRVDPGRRPLTPSMSCATNIEMGGSDRET